MTHKEFGIRLAFTPTIAGDVIRIKVKPEVSSLDFANGVTLAGFRIPALITRRAETDVELRDGQSFAIAGLLNNLSQTDRQAIPILSKLPVIGNLFEQERASRADRADGAHHAAWSDRSIRMRCALPTRPGSFITPTRKKCGKITGSRLPSRRAKAWLTPPLAPDAKRPPTAPDPATKKPPKLLGIGAIDKEPPPCELTPKRRRRNPRLIVRGGDLVSGEPHDASRNCDGGADRFNGLVIDYGILWLARRQA